MTARLLGFIAVLGLFIGCGGRSVQVTFQVTGRILSVTTGGAPNPAASVQIGRVTALTEAGSGTFVLQAAKDASSLIVSQPGILTFVFSLLPITAPTDLGDFWIGPEVVNIVGTVLDAQSGLGVPQASVSFAGRKTLTQQNGDFVLENVAYDSNSQFVFFGIIGRVEKEGYVTAEFNANQNPVQNIITLPPILLAPTSDPIPPGPPFNLWGIVTVQGGNSSGTIVSLIFQGSTFRLQNLTSDGKYLFWVPPADYILRFEKSGFQTAEIPISGFTSPDQVIRNDITLIPN
jgi:hypothetical protein